MEPTSTDSSPQVERLNSSPEKEEKKKLIEYVLFAEFDLETGSTLKHKYPNDGTFEDNVNPEEQKILADLMICDGSHRFEFDWTIFFLNRRLLTRNLQEERNRTSCDDSDWVELPSSSPTETSIPTTEPTVTSSSSDSKGTRRIFSKLRNISGRHSLGSRRKYSINLRSSTELQHSGSIGLPQYPFYYCLNVVHTFRSSEVTRGATIQSIALVTTVKSLHIFKPLLLLAMRECMQQHVNQDEHQKRVLEKLYNTINRVPFPSTLNAKLTFPLSSFMYNNSQISENPCFTTTIQWEERSAVSVTPPITSSTSMISASSPDLLRKSNSHNGTSSSRTERPLASSGSYDTATLSKSPSKGSSKKLSKSTSAEEYSSSSESEEELYIPSDPTVHICVPYLRNPNEIGEGSLRLLISTFDTGVMTIFNSLLCGERILFVASTGQSTISKKRSKFRLSRSRSGTTSSLTAATATSVICNYVLSSLLLISPVRVSRSKVFPYVNVNDLTCFDILQLAGYVAGTTNPWIEQQAVKSNLYDIICDVTTGKVSRNGSSGSARSLWPQKKPSEDLDKEFYTKITFGIKNLDCDETWIRKRFQEYTQYIIDVTFGMEPISSSFDPQNDQQQQPGSQGQSDPRMDHVQLNSDRSAKWKTTKSFSKYVKEWTSVRQNSKIDVNSIVRQLKSHINKGTKSSELSRLVKQLIANIEKPEQYHELLFCVCKYDVTLSNVLPFVSNEVAIQLNQMIARLAIEKQHILGHVVG